VLADDGQLRVYALGNWPAPFGIVLVLDRLAAAMTLLTALLAFPALLYASSASTSADSISTTCSSCSYLA
jgi:multicomponent K+:H+ antiporter subunit D